MTQRIVELFAGIGGYRCAWPEANSIGAFEIDRDAATTYLLNWTGQVRIGEIATLSESDPWLNEADAWLMSPPCQPFSVRGEQHGLDDPRSAALLHVVDLVKHIRPRSIVLENVPGYQASTAGELWRSTLSQCGYAFRETIVCPTEFGLPNRRLRYYCIASRAGLGSIPAKPRYKVSLRELIEQADAASSPCAADLELDAELIARFGSALDRVSLADVHAITACFGSSYGKSLKHAGSYLEVGEGRLRRFAPAEVLCLLGFPVDFRFPADMRLRTAWRLAGNSLSIPVVRWNLAQLPGGPDAQWNAIERNAD
ncbi:MAG: DNA (cytosine-5-)-methyltransferase [Pirellulales bacterium]